MLFVKKLILFVIFTIVLFSVPFVSCRTSGDHYRDPDNAAIVRVIRGYRDSLEFEAELFGLVDTLRPRVGDSLEAVFGDRQTGKMIVLQLDEDSRYIRLQFTEEGVRTNFDDYIVGGAYLEIRPDADAVRQTGGASAIDS